MPKEPMLETMPSDGAAPSLGSEVTPAETIADQVAEIKPDSKPEPQEKPWQVFLQSAKTKDIKERFIREIEKTLAAHGMQKYCVLALLEPEDSIDSYDLDAIFDALSKLNPDRSKDVLLVLLSRGGSIEPAYQISKLCKSFAKDRFIAVVPRHAKSAATLVSIGADEIHMGRLGS